MSQLSQSSIMESLVLHKTSNGEIKLSALVIVQIKAELNRVSKPHLAFLYWDYTLNVKRMTHIKVPRQDPHNSMTGTTR